MRSIRAHLAASLALPGSPPAETDQTFFRKSVFNPRAASLTHEFKRNLELVDDRCLSAQDGTEVAELLKRITEGARIAVAGSPLSKEDLFTGGVGIPSAQAGIAETGTLVLDSSGERSRLGALVPPIHIA